jgi:ribosomal protein S18 acetylase RimI-like enzyme
LSHQAGACGFVAIESNKIIGYVCGIWEPKVLRRELFRSQWLKLGWWIIIQAINKPSVFFNLIRRYQNSTSIEDEGSAYELRPIVVLPEYRRKGVAGLLLNILIEDAARRGFDRIILYTEDDNIAAQSFYIKEKFNLVTIVSRNGTIYHRYERKLESVAS